MNQHEWDFVSEYGLMHYRNGLKQGDLLKLTQELIIRDHNGNPTSKIHPIGETWTVLPGVESEPEVIWLREPSGTRHTWDVDSIYDWFTKLEEGG